MSFDSNRTADTLGYGTMMNQSSLDPLPVQYASVPAPLSVPMAVRPPPPLIPTMPFETSDADRVLDEAVEELFLHEAGEMDSLAEFVHDWDPSNQDVETLEIEDDLQLGFLLDKLLEE